MFKIKDDFSVTLHTGRIVTNKVWVKNDTLFLVDGETTYKFVEGAWYIKTPLTNNEYIPLGIGALPGYIINETINIEDADAFNALFVEVADETETA